MNEMSFISLEEAQARLIASITPLEETVKVPLLQALGMTQYEDKYASIDLPPFNRSPLDGYAVRSADIECASADVPRVLTVVTCSELEGFLLPIGHAFPVMTGGVIPAGADCVVRQEDTDRGDKQLRVFVSMMPYENYCYKGEDVPKGKLLIKAGERVHLGHQALLAAQGVETISAVRPLKVGLLITGQEFTLPGVPLTQGKIYDCNSTLIASRLLSAKYEVQLSYCGDDPSALTSSITDLVRGCDLVIATGGVSVGVDDHVPSVCSLIGAEKLLHGISAKPLAPTLAMQLDNKLIICLSGNPFAALATFEMLVRPALIYLSGGSNVLPQYQRAVAQTAFKKESHTRRFIRAKLQGERAFIPDQGHSSGAIGALAECNCLVDIPEGTPSIEIGDLLSVVPF